MLNKRSAGTPFIFITIILDMIAMGIMIPNFVPLVLGFTHGSFAQASLLSGVFAMLFAAMQFFISPILGVLSDKIGRRPIVLLSNLGTSIDYAILALAPNVGWLFIGRALSGATTSSISVASAYIADVTPEEKRASAYGMISACFGVGFVVGPAVGGLVASWLGLRAPFWVAAALSLVNFIYGYFVLPESLAKENRNEFSWKRANPLGSLKMLRRHTELFGLAIVMLIGYVAHEALPQLWVLYTMDVYKWDQRMNGLSLALVGVITIVIMMSLVAPTVKRFGERTTLLMGLLFGATGFMMYAGNIVLFWVGVPINMLWMLGTACMQSIMTRRVGKNEQGELQGAIQMLRSVGMILGPPIFTGTFAYSVSDSHAWKAPGAGWILGGAILLASLVVAWFVTAPSDNVHDDKVDTIVILENTLAEVPAIE
jgi:MFS transporter, DHA1 family, tetracycline resistance protein